jgi:hypothetical protein
MKKYKYTLNIKWLALAMFVTISSIMLLLCYEWVLEYRGITEFMPTQVVPIVYAIMILGANYYLCFKAFYVRKDGE